MKLKKAGVFIDLAAAASGSVVAGGGATTDPSFVNSTTAYINNTETVSPAKPTGVIAGDLLLFVARGGCGGGIDFDQVPAGFTKLVRYDGGTYPTHIYYKIATASEPANYTFGKTGSSFPYWSYSLLAYRNAGVPTNVTTGGNPAADQTPTIHSMVLDVYSGPPGAAYSPVSGWTLDGNVGNPGIGLNIGIFRKIFSAAAAAINTGNPGNSANVSISMLIQAPAGNYTLQLADAGSVVEMAAPSASTLTIPLESVVAFPVGTSVKIRRTGTGDITIAGTGGVTITPTTPVIATQWREVELHKRGPDTWEAIWPESKFEKGVANGYAGLGSDGRVPAGQLPVTTAPAVSAIPQDPELIGIAQLASGNIEHWITDVRTSVPTAKPGDTVVFVVGLDNGAVPASAGWTALGAQVANTGSTAARAFSRVLDGSANDSFNAWTGVNGALSRWQGIYFVYRNAGVVGAPVTSSPATGASFTFPAIPSTPNGRRMQVLFMSSGNSDDQPPLTPSGYAYAGLSPRMANALNARAWEGPSSLADPTVSATVNFSNQFANPILLSIPIASAGSLQVTLDSIRASTPGLLIGETDYATATDTTLAAISSSVLVDVDAAHLSVTFVAPASGKVLVTLTCPGYGTAANQTWFGIREGSTDIALAFVGSDANMNGRIAVLVVSGLVPGSVHTYKWAAKVNSSTFNFMTGPTYGRAIMQVTVAA